MRPLRRYAKFVPALVLLALAIPSSASAQATRTWVSGVGDDANPCSRTAPCKTFAGAISKTATTGEINCLDPGGFGGVTITKAITIKCHYTEGGVLVSGTNAIVVNAPTTATVTLRGLDINGIGTGLNGIRILQAKSVKILDSEIYNFVRSGVDVENNGGTTVKVVVDRNHIHDNNGVGVLGAPPTTGVARIHVRHNIIDENVCALVASKFGPDPAFNFGINCGTQGPDADTATVAINALNNDIADHTSVSVLSSGNVSVIRIGGNVITGSLTQALQAINSGQLLTFGNNTVTGNPGGNGATTGSAGGFTKRRAKHKG
jgi:hypothetical protein